MENSDAFNKRIQDTVKASFVTFGLALGQKLGLFEVLAKQDQPVTARNLGLLTGCREALFRLLQFPEGVVVDDAASDIVTITDTEGRYFLLPQECRVALTSVTSDVVSKAKFVPMFFSQFKALSECFKQNGPPGLGSESGEDIWPTWQEGRSKHFEEYLPACLSHLPDVALKLEQGASVLDIGTYDGGMVQILGSKYPRSVFIGSDIDQEAISNIQPIQGQDNVSFQVQDALKLPQDWTEKFDYVTLNHCFQHLPDKEKASKEIRRVLKTGGYVSILEIPRDVNFREDVKLPNAVSNYMFEMMWCGGEGEGHDPGSGVKQNSDSEPKDHQMVEEQGGQKLCEHGIWHDGTDSAKGHHHNHHDDQSVHHDQNDDQSFHGVSSGIQKLKEALNKGGFENILIKELPKVDIADNVHIFFQK